MSPASYCFNVANLVIAAHYLCLGGAYVVMAITHRS